MVARAAVKFIQCFPFSGKAWVNCPRISFYVVLFKLVSTELGDSLDSWTISPGSPGSPSDI